jgi:hypothetical protein
VVIDSIILVRTVQKSAPRVSWPVHIKKQGQVQKQWGTYQGFSPRSFPDDRRRIPQRGSNRIQIR